MIGDSCPIISHAQKSTLHLQCVGCDKKILWPSVGLQSGLIGTGWSSLASLGKMIHRQYLTEEVRAAESILRPGTAKLLKREALQILSGGAGASHRAILKELAGMVLSEYDGARGRPGRPWRGVVPYDRSHGRLPAPARELSQI
jgi:hypothetical protein